MLTSGNDFRRCTAAKELLEQEIKPS
jgi:hypothetical protein